MVEAWYIQDKGGETRGPFSEKQIQGWLDSGEIDGMRVRQGGSEWCDVSRARAIFRHLASIGWYVQHRGTAHGPFTDAKLRELYRSGEVDSDSEIRQGTTGPWKPAGAILARWQPQAVQAETPNPETAESGPAPDSKWSTEPICHVVVSVVGLAAKNMDGSDRAEIVARCKRRERLFLEYPADHPSEEGLLRVVRTNGRQLGCLSRADTQRILGNTQRGVTHIALLDSTQVTDRSAGLAVKLIVVLCPPGTQSGQAARYISQVLTTSPAD